MSGRWPAPLSQRLFCAVGGVERMVTQHTWLGLGDGHVQHPCVVLVPRGGMRRAGGEAELRCGGLAGGVVIRHGGDIRHTGLKAGAAGASTSAAASAGGGWRRGLAVFMESVKRLRFYHRDIDEAGRGRI